MATLTNSAESGTPGTAVTTGNSGGASGTAFNRVQADSSVLYTSDSYKGSVAIHCNGASDAYVGWDGGIPGTVATLHLRVYFKLTAIPASATNLFRWLSSSNGIMGTVRVNADGKVAQLYSSGSLGQTSTSAISAGVWYRLEGQVTAGTGTGSISSSVYAGDSLTPLFALNTTNVTTGAANPSRVRCGVLSSSTSIILDDLAASDAGPIGPSAGGGPEPITGSLSATLPALTSQILTKTLIGGSLTGTLPSLQMAVSGEALQPPVVGTLSASLPALQAGMGVSQTNPGSLAATLPSLQASFSTAQGGGGSLSATLPRLQASFSVSQRADGSLSASFPSLEVAFTGEVEGPNTGTLVASLPALTAGMSVSQEQGAVLTANLPAMTSQWLAGEPVGEAPTFKVGGPRTTNFDIGLKPAPRYVGSPTTREI